MNVAAWLHRKEWLRSFALNLPGPLRRPLRFIWQRWLRQSVLNRPLPFHGRKPNLPAELVVSLTSYPARFSILPLTLRSLLTQSMTADRVVLWLAHEDVQALPKSVTELQKFGLEIRGCDDLRSFKKLIPSVDAFPSAYIVTADDDLYYPPDWLEVLIEGAGDDLQTIACRRVVRPKVTADGRLAPFNEWEWDVGDDSARRPSPNIMLESGAGALFPPCSLHPMLADRSLFLELCADADDLWFNTCARMAGTCCKKVGGSLWLTSWHGSQSSSLWDSNIAGGNDRMIQALQARFGADLFVPTVSSNCTPSSERPTALPPSGQATA